MAQKITSQLHNWYYIITNPSHPCLIMSLSGGLPALAEAGVTFAGESLTIGTNVAAAEEYDCYAHHIPHSHIHIFMLTRHTLPSSHSLSTPSHPLTHSAHPPILPLTLSTPSHPPTHTQHTLPSSHSHSAHPPILPLTLSTPSCPPTHTQHTLPSSHSHSAHPPILPLTLSTPSHPPTHTQRTLPSSHSHSAHSSSFSQSSTRHSWGKWVAVSLSREG